jgi:single-stranded DNA-specific DHH superfamily exonuclease
MRARITALNPSALIVLDMGSRPQPILPGIRTLVIDHHHAGAGLPPGAVVVNGYDREPVATSSVLAFVVCRPTSPHPDSWLAALGAIADLGSASPFSALLGMHAAGARWKRAVALLNAARRAERPDPMLALAALRRARSVDDLSSGRSPEGEQLQRLQEQVNAEINRCARAAPTVVNDVALVRFSSGAQVHPIIAIRWAQRLRGMIVIAANDGYLSGRTNFAVRSVADIDLVKWLRSLPFTPGEGAEYAHGHARATGGSLSPAEFDKLLLTLGFAAAAAQNETAQRR